MSIGAGLTLVTGPTGGGKTCAVVSWLKDIKDRPLFVMGIPELKIEHHRVPPVEEWTELRPDPDDPSKHMPYFRFPPHAIIILDEAQRIYRPRPAASKVPPEVAAFETRRHTGVDFVLITQHPGLLDSNIRKLVTRHIHIHDTFMGRYMLEWVGAGDPENRNSRELATRKRYKPPKEAFDLYKSAEVHTKIVRKYPWYMKAFAVLVPVALYVGWMVYDSIQGRMAPKTVATAPAKPIDQTPRHESASMNQNAPQGRFVTAEEYIALYTPRIKGLQHTAPAYDAVTNPVEPPEPVGCIQSPRTGCNCYTQQGTKYDTTPGICEQILKGGIYKPWKKTEPYQAPVQPVAKAIPSEPAIPPS